ncbi:MAG: hypothetical protein LLF98_11090 [Clostridium sp.]|uniref:hypothetical protein n=1 Tax=Clostridium sp. TaxID=1506 RepID=UPI0025BB24CF|nr:hypothetical protein [Clostridium sp.]MCE5221774.1 hypothetical protein [Clostridium sp.]
MSINYDEFKQFIERDLIIADEITLGDTILFTEDVYSEDFPHARKIGLRTILATIIKQFYGNRYMTFSLEIRYAIGCESADIIKQRFIRRRDYKLFYKKPIYRELWKNDNCELNRCYLVDEQRLYKYYLSQKC